LFVSDPLSAPLAARTQSIGTASKNSVGNTDIVYVSLSPGTLAAGALAIVRRVGDPASVTTAVVDGGFEPVPVGARVGDSVEVKVSDAGGSVVLETRLAVLASRRPVVVRTFPPPGKRDQPLNANIVIVFSEPVADGSLASSIELLRDGMTVPGAVGVLQGTVSTVAFVPAADLDANSSYSLVVTHGVRDLSGDALAADTTVQFMTAATTVGSVTGVKVVPDTTAIVIGSQVQLTPAAHDTAGTPIVGRPYTWSSDDSAVATVSANGLVTALASGVAHIQAELDGQTAIATILVSSSLTPVNTMELQPKSAKAVIGGFVQLTAVLRDAAGNIVRFRTVSWQSSDASVASVSAAAGGTAVVSGLAAGTATIIASSEGKRATATVTIGTIGPFTQISTGEYQSCALASGGLAWCWGADFNPSSGVLGNGTQLGSLVPTAVTGGLSFSQVSAGDAVSCGLTTSGDAYCWGENSLGALGSGDSLGAERVSPVVVAGGRRYSMINAGGGSRACALSSGAAYCWGYNYVGALGLASTAGLQTCNAGDTCSTVPGRVAGTQTFTNVSLGYYHTCGLTGAGQAYCWGRGDYGALGDGTHFDRGAPTLVKGGLAFTVLSAGGLETCGLTSNGTAYCWGINDDGELGTGTITGPEGPCVSPVDPNREVGNCSTVPVPVAGALRFTQISAGFQHVCALTSSGSAYCWGFGQPLPAAVPGGLAFTRVSASAQGTHTCALTTAGIAYCWGSNSLGELGDGTQNDSSVPVKVSGQP
jgi:hypothetical protein